MISNIMSRIKDASDVLDFRSFILDVLIGEVRGYQQESFKATIEWQES